MLVFPILRPPHPQKHLTLQPTAGKNPLPIPLRKDSSANSSANPLFPNLFAQRASKRNSRFFIPSLLISQRQQLVSHRFAIGAKPIPTLFDSTLRSFVVLPFCHALHAAFHFSLLHASGIQCLQKSNNQKLETNSPTFRPQSSQKNTSPPPAIPTATSHSLNTAPKNNFSP